MTNRNSIKPILLALLLIVTIGCKTEKGESDVIDSTAIESPNLDSTTNSNEVSNPVPEITISEEEATKDFIDLNQFLVNIPLDTSEFQLITTTCAIIIERTKADIQALEDFEAQQEAEQQARRKKMSEAELAHDDSVTEEENMIMGDDGAYYDGMKDEGLSALAAVKIVTITAQDKKYLKLIDLNKKEWIIDIRSNMQQGWAAVFFNAKKEPKVIDLINVNKGVVIHYFSND